MARTLRPAPQRALHHITRIDIEPSEAHPGRHPTHGWQVRARRAGTRLSKFFADARHGGRDGALDAAKTYRDALLDSLPDPNATPRKAWSNTGVVGLSVREKAGASGPRQYVQLNWVDADGKRRTASFSVEKWGLRRALWEGCVRLHEERQAAGSPVDPIPEMFASAQAPFAEQIEAEIAAEEAEAASAPADASEATPAPEADSHHARRTELNREKFESPEAELAREQKRLEQLEKALFG